MIIGATSPAARRIAGLLLAAMLAAGTGNLACLRPAAAAEYAFDIDGSGAPDANLLLSPCQAKPASVCLELKSAKLGSKEFLLSDNAKASAIHIGLIGRQFDGPLAAAFVYWLTGADATGASGPLVSLTIFDLNGAGQKAWVRPPLANSAEHFEGYSVRDTYFAVIEGPGGKRYPLVAPGQRHLNQPYWHFLCLFDPTKIARPDPACGTGFRSVGATFPGAEHLSQFRHSGGWLEDVDGDGWQDINLPFLAYILVISGKTGDQLALLHPEIARHAEPDAPRDFDSGRFYGSFTPFIAADGKRDVLIASADTVGTFNDIYCNVARYYAVLETAKPGDPRSRGVKWADYISFVKNHFSGWAASEENITRRGDGIDKCVHRVSDSVFHAKGHLFTLFNEFTTSPPLDPRTCLRQQIAEWKSHFPPDKMQEWRDCAKASFEAATGDWQVQLLDLANGRHVGQWPNGYVWGRIKNFVKGYPETFLLEEMGQQVRFDQSGYSPRTFWIIAVNPDFTWRRLGEVPAAVRPRIASGGIPDQGSTGSSFQGIWDIVTRADADGLTDIQLKDGRWIGYSAQTQTCVVKP